MFHLGRRKGKAGPPGRESYSDVADSLGAAVFILDVDRRIRFLNAEARNRWGAVEGQECFRVLRDARESCRDCPLDEVLEGQGLVTAECRMKSLDGWNDCENLFIQVGTPAYGQQFIALVVTDVGRRKSLEQEFFREKELSKTLLMSPTTLVICMDDSANITLVNRAVQRLSGYSESEIASGGLEALVPRESRKALSELLAPVGSGSTGPAVVPLVTKSGEEKAVSWTRSELYAADGTPEGLICMGQDVTDSSSAAREAEARARELESVNAALALTAGAGDEEEMMGAAIGALMEIPDYCCGVAYVLERGGLSARLVDSFGMEKPGPPPVVEGAGNVFPASSLYSRRTEVATEKTPMHPAARELFEREGLAGLLSIPVTAAGRPLGLLIMGRRQEPEKPGRELVVLEAVAEALELGAENFYLRRDAEQKAREATAILRVVQGLTGGGDQNLALEKVAKEASCLLGVDNATIFLVDESGEKLFARAGHGWDWRAFAEDGFPLSDSGTALEAFRTKQPVVVEDAQSDPRVPDAVKKLGVKASLTLPLVVEGRCTGVLFLDTTGFARRFSDHEVGLMETFAVHAAVAIRNATLVGSLAVSEERYRTLVDSAEDIVFTVDPNGTVSFVNESVRGTLGYKPEEIAGRRALDFVPREYRSLVPEWERSLMSGRRVDVLDLRMKTREGEKRFLSIAFSPLKLGDKVVGVMGVARDVTGRAQAEKTLKESEERYRLLAENVIDVIWTLNRELELTYVSPSVENLTGFSPEEFVSKSVRELLPPDSYRRCRDILKSGLEAEGEGKLDSGAAWSADVEHYNKDGSTGWIELRMSALRDAEGEAVGILGVARDISGRRAAEEAIKESEERYRLIADNSLAGIFVHDGTEILYMNDRAKEITGYPGDHFKSMDDILGLLPEGERARVVDYIRRRLAGEDVPNVYDTRVIRADGGVAVVQLMNNSISIGGRPAIMVMFHDVTERDKARRELEESEQRYRTILENSSDLIVVSNRAGEVLYANPASERVFGYTPEEIVGRHLFQFIHPDDRERVARDFMRDWKTGQTIPDYPLRCVRADGSVIEVEATSGLVGWPREDALQVFVVRDVTERRRRQAEQELRLRVEEGLASIAARFVEPGDINAAIAETLQGSAELLGVDWSLYFEISPDGETMSVAHEWSSPGVESTRDELQEIDVEEFPWLMKTLGAHGEVVYSDVNDIPGTGTRDFLRGHRVYALAAAPVFVSDRLAGFVALHDIRASREWSVHEVELLRSIAGTISSALERKGYVEEIGRSERFLARVTENIAEGLAVIKNGVVEWTNRQLAQVHGYGPDELIGESPEVLMAGREEFEDYVKRLLEAIEEEGGYVSEEKAARKDGTIFDVELAVAPLGEDEEGNVELVVAIRDITESKRMQREVEAAADAYSTLFSTAGDGLIVHTVDGWIIDANERASQYTGYPRGELLDMNVTDLVPGEARHLYPERREEIRAEGQTVFEALLEGKEGGRVPVEVTARMTKIWGDTVVLSSLRDITERKEAEEQINRRAFQLAALNEIVKAATSSLDLETVLDATLDVALEATEAEAGMFVLRTPPSGEVIRVATTRGDPEKLEGIARDEEARSALLATMADCRSSVITGEGRAAGMADVSPSGLAYLRGQEFKQGIIIPLVSGEKLIGVMGLASTSPDAFHPGDSDFYDTAGAEIGVSIENSLIYRELAAEHERLSLLYRSTQRLSSSLELDVLLELTAEEASRALGAKSALIGLIEPGFDYYRWAGSYNLDLGQLSDVRVPVEGGMGGEAFRKKRAVTVDVDLQRRIKDPVWERLGVEGAVMVPLVAGDSVLGVMGVHLPGKRLTDEDILLLEAIGRQAGVALENARLYQETRGHLEALEKAHRELMVLDRMKSDFVSTVSHELRSPLAVIEGFAKTLVEHFDRIDRDTERESIEIILKKAIALEGLIENILDMSRIEDGRLEVVPQRFDLVEVCEAVRADQERVADEHQVLLEASPESFEVIADREKTEVALGNLVRNAVKFSPGGGNITITATKLSGVAEVGVTDEGIGITPEDQERIFDRFYQADSSETRAFQGSGLGLYITRGLVETMGGEVSVESVPGKGSTFTFTLPLPR